MHKWVLMSVTGEASIIQDDAGGRPTAPHPRLSPEAVVEAQLAALRCVRRQNTCQTTTLFLRRLMISATRCDCDPCL